MMLTRYMSPMLVHDSFDQRVNQLFDEAFRRVGSARPTRLLPWNVCEKDDRFWIDAAVPGLTGDDVNLTIKDGILTMTVGNKAQEEDDRTDYHLQEIGVDAVSRSMKLPSYVDPDKAKATCTNGMLTIAIPKRAEALARQVPVEDREAS